MPSDLCKTPRQISREAQLKNCDAQRVRGTGEHRNPPKPRKPLSRADAAKLEAEIRQFEPASR
jgi:hypothetical protein